MALWAACQTWGATSSPHSLLFLSSQTICIRWNSPSFRAPGRNHTSWRKTYHWRCQWEQLAGEGNGIDLLPEALALKPQIHHGRSKGPLDVSVTSKQFSCFVAPLQAVNFFQKPAVRPTGKETQTYHFRVSTFKNPVLAKGEGGASSSLLITAVMLDSSLSHSSAAC